MGPNRGAFDKKKYQRNCKECKNPFSTNSKERRFCCDNCRNKNWCRDNPRVAKERTE